MRPLKDVAQWPPLAVYDIETTEWINVVLLCHVDELGNRVHFDNVPDYVDWLFYHFKGEHVWAHAGGRFDHRFLIPEIDRRGWDFRAALSGGSIVLLTAKHNANESGDTFGLFAIAMIVVQSVLGLAMTTAFIRSAGSLDVSRWKQLGSAEQEVSSEIPGGLSNDSNFRGGSVANETPLKSAAVHEDATRGAVD